MKAAIFKGSGLPLQVGEFVKPKPVKDQVLIKLNAAALNHRDLWIQEEQEQVSRPEGVILGSDGVGTVTDVGEDADPLMIGMEVIINPSLEWGANPIVQGDNFKILGFPDNGTFGEFIAISKKYIFERPEGLSVEECAAVPLSGLTAYRALFTKARLRAKEKVLITGIGGGAALWALTYAVAYGARVYVTSGSDQKIQQAVSLGAVGGFNYHQGDWAEQAAKATGGFDIIIDSAGGDGFAKLIEIALPGGRLVNFGRTAGVITNIPTRLLYWKQLSIFGSTMGTRDEFLSMIDFIESRKLKPVIDSVFKLDQINEAFARMQSPDHFGKIVIRL
ncbi:MAG: zinc-binding dehydrogenase [Cyclobacteriaceae bacterium]|nr:zinc-binding dehydrogenase [Cyclobacteriaceae bacterium]